MHTCVGTEGSRSTHPSGDGPEWAKAGSSFCLTIWKQAGSVPCCGPSQSSCLVLWSPRRLTSEPSRACASMYKGLQGT